MFQRDFHWDSSLHSWIRFIPGFESLSLLFMLVVRKVHGFLILSVKLDGIRNRVFLCVCELFLYFSFIWISLKFSAYNRFSSIFQIGGFQYSKKDLVEEQEEKKTNISSMGDLVVTLALNESTNHMQILALLAHIEVVILCSNSFMVNFCRVINCISFFWWMKNHQNRPFRPFRRRNIIRNNMFENGKKTGWIEFLHFVYNLGRFYADNQKFWTCYILLYDLVELLFNLRHFLCKFDNNVIILHSYYQNKLHKN